MTRIRGSPDFSDGVWIVDVDLHLVTETSQVRLISNWWGDCRVRVCLAAVEVPVEGSLPEPGPGHRSGPYP